MLTALAPIGVQYGLNLTRPAYYADDLAEHLREAKAAERKQQD